MDWLEWSLGLVNDGTQCSPPAITAECTNNSSGEDLPDQPRGQDRPRQGAQAEENTSADDEQAVCLLEPVALNLKATSLRASVELLPVASIYLSTTKIVLQFQSTSFPG